MTDKVHYRSDVSLVKAMTADAAIRSGDSKQKVIDLFGQPFDRHKEEHRWSYFFAYGTPHADSTPMVAVTVWFGGDVVRDVEVWFRPARDTVVSAKGPVQPGTTAEEVLRKLGRPRERTGNKWRYSWEYHHNSLLFLDVTFAEDQTVRNVRRDSVYVDCE
jgi:outer membrane protein assembly factor BamE (lipoprotein component of BamABCDE complex)